MNYLAYIDLGQTHGMVLDKANDLAYVANDKKGLSVVNLEGITQPTTLKPIVLDTTINILESDTPYILAGDSIGQVRIWDYGDSPLYRSWIAEFRNKYGDIICGDAYLCDNEYTYFNIDTNGSILINNQNSLSYENIGNQVLFTAYTENDNGHKSHQAKVTINIKEDPEWSLQFQKNVIKIDNNISVGTPIVNVFARQSKRELFLVGVYEPYYWCSTEYLSEKTRDGYTYKEAVEEMCIESTQFSIDKNGTVFTKDVLDVGQYIVDIIAVDRFGLKWFAKQTIEVLEP